jgi:acetaldehyde dehydrogenase/alcohol dehydrogenase
MAHKIGGAFHVPHGLANALLISNVIRYNSNENPTKQAAFSQYDRPKAKCRYAEVADHLGLGGKNTTEKVEALIAWVESLKKDLDIPVSIQAAGVDEADFLSQLDAVAEDAFDDQCTGANPRYPLISEFRTILLDTYYGRVFSEVRADDSEVAPQKAAASNGSVKTKAVEAAKHVASNEVEEVALVR